MLANSIIFRGFFIDMMSICRIPLSMPLIDYIIIGWNLYYDAFIIVGLLVKGIVIETLLLEDLRVECLRVEVLLTEVLLIEALPTEALLIEASPVGWNSAGWSPAGWSPAGWSPAGWSPAGWSPAGWSPAASKWTKLMDRVIWLAQNLLMPPLSSARSWRTEKVVKRSPQIWKSKEREGVAHKHASPRKEKV